MMITVKRSIFSIFREFEAFTTSVLNDINKRSATNTLGLPNSNFELSMSTLFIVSVCSYKATTNLILNNLQEALLCCCIPSLKKSL